MTLRTRQLTASKNPFSRILFDVCWMFPVRSRSYRILSLENRLFVGFPMGSDKEILTEVCLGTCYGWYLSGRSERRCDQRKENDGQYRSYHFLSNISWPEP